MLLTIKQCKQKEKFMNSVKILQEHNLKVTPQRLEILNLLHTNGHLSVDDMYKLLQHKFPALSLATIYKNIKRMSAKLLLSEVKIPQSKSVYELSKQEHSHIVCQKCNNIMDVDLDISNLTKQAISLSNYTIEESLIVLSGICPKCKISS